MKGGNAIELPAPRDFLQESVLNVAIERKLPDTADDQALVHVEIRERAVQPGVERVSVSGGARAETGTEVNHFSPGVGASQSKSLAESFVNGELELVAVRKSIAEIRIDLEYSGECTVEDRWA